MGILGKVIQPQPGIASIRMAAMCSRYRPAQRCPAGRSMRKQHDPRSPLVDPSTTVRWTTTLAWTRCSAAAGNLLDSEVDADDRIQAMHLAGLGPLHGAVEPVSIG